MNLLTTLRLSVAGGRSDRVRIVLTAISAALGTVSMLCAATVAAVDSSRATRYTNDLLNESGLRPGVALAMVLLTVPALALVAQCSGSVLPRGSTGWPRSDWPGRHRAR